MKSASPRHLLLAAATLVAATLAAASSVSAANVVWNNATTGGLWNTTGNWTGGVAADGTGNIADFSTLDITTDNTVHLDGSHTINGLIFGDITTATAAGWTLDNNGNAANILTLGGTTPTITVNALGTGKSATISAEIAGTAGLTKTGAGTLVLTAANSYTGTTTISAGTLALTGGDNRLAVAGTVAFSGAGTLDIGSTSQTLANLTVGNTITGIVNGSGGTLSLTGASFSLGGGTNQTNTLNLSGLTTFNYTNSGGTFRVSGVQNGVAAGGAGALTLAGGTNTITASVFGVGDFGSTQNTSVNSGTVNLGVTNTINADTITIGGTRGAGVLQYLSGTDTSLTLRGTNGTDRVTSMILSNQGGPNTTGTVQGVVNLTGNVTGTSTLDAMIDTLTIGKNTRNVAAGGNSIVNTGTFTMGAGTLDATTIYLAQNTAGFSAGGTTSKTTGNLTVGAGGTIKVGNFYFADQNTSGSTGSALEANFNLNGGANLYAANIAVGTGAGTWTATRTFNWNDGTIHNYDASTDLTFGSGITVKLAATGTHTFDIGASRSATIGSVISDVTTLGTLVKAGTGTLTLSGANTYTGGTTLNAGTLTAGHVSALGTGAATVNTGGTLNVNGLTLANAVTVNGGTLAGGAGSTLNGAITVGASGVNVASGATLALNSDMTLATGAITSNGTGLVANAGTLTLGGAGMLDLGGAFDGYTGGSTYKLISGAFSGSFANAADVTGYSTGVWSKVSFDAGTGNLVFTAVPEPGTYGLIGAGALAAVAFVRRRRRHAGMVVA